MSLQGRQRTQHQKAQAAAMRKRRWLPGPRIEDKVINPGASRERRPFRLHIDLPS